MQKKYGYILACLVYFLPFIINAQNKFADSLKTVINTTTEDSIKINALNYLTNYISTFNLDSAIIINKQALALSEKINWKMGKMGSEFLLGKHFYLKGDYAKALDYFLKALKKTEELHQVQFQSSIVSFIGSLYLLENNYPKALENYSVALSIAEASKNKALIVSHVSNIGLTYAYMNNTKKALDYLLRSLKLYEELNDERGVAVNLDFIGFTYSSAHNYPEALNYLSLALKKNEKFGDKLRILDNLRNIGWVYIYTGKFKDAELNLKKALLYSEELGHLQGIEGVNEALSKLYDTTGKSELAFLHYKMYINARDSIASEEGKRKQLRTEMNYEFEKKEAVLNEQQEKDRLVAEEKNRFQKIVIVSFAFGLLLVIIFAAFIYRSLKVTRSRKLIIEEKQKEILDSIRYAKRIQTSLLPTEKYIQKQLKIN